MSTLTAFLLTVALAGADSAELDLKLDERIKNATRAVERNPRQVRVYSERGDAYFFRGRFAESVADYEKMVELNPSLDASHWRRGIAHFYAGQYRKGARQFEVYHSFDDVDRENGIWRYFCQYMAYGREKARKGLLKYKKDDREPFGDVYRLFSGSVHGDEILKKIADADISSNEREKRYFYAYLYIGLNDFIEGRYGSALATLEKCVANRWGPEAGFGPNYMWHVGRVHRDWLQRRARNLPFDVELGTATKGFDGKMCWVHARAGTIPPGARGNPGEKPLVVMTAQKLFPNRSDVFSGLHVFQSRGEAWTKAVEESTLRRRTGTDGKTEAVPCDFTPKFHEKTGVLLGTGKTFWYSKESNNHIHHAPSEVVYAVFDAVKGSWKEWKTVELPKRKEFENANAGCSQRFDLPNGDVLLPIYFRNRDEQISSITVLRCSFDGETLRYKEHGSEHTVATHRGLAEPSLTEFGGKFFLTIRHDTSAYVTSSDDGLRFGKSKEWRFDDGKILGSYNTQQHWLRQKDGLFLVYTRRGANNDHVFRHRAPLFIARVDPERLVVLRESELILVPERGTRIGNFGVTRVSDDEFWVTTCEWMQPRSVEKYGSDNSLFVAKIRWRSEKK
ncbi:MAG: hypothetical protein AAF517_05955 [Planctomycetota bacterium]